MLKKLVLLAVLALVGFLGYVGYEDYYLGDFHNAPDTGESGFSLSYKSGFKAAMKDIPKDNNRRYLGYPNPKTPSVYEDSWSICRTPTELESSNFAGRAEKIPGERLEGICEIDADGDVFIRGWVSSIPDV